MVEAELFGCERGAFTGIQRRQDWSLSWLTEGIFLTKLVELLLDLQATVSAL